MNKGRNTALLVVIVIVIIGAFLWSNRNATWLAPLLGTNTPGMQTQSGKADYTCDMGKTITATYYSGAASTPSDPNMPPVPNGSAALVLGDGRTITLPQTISGSGIRYANADESLVFWSKGNTAFLVEGTGENAAETYSNCITSSNLTGQENWSVYATSSLGFSIKYPAGFTPTAPYAYQAMGPGKTINGVKFTIPASMATGTNLSVDSYIAVEQLPANAQNCSASLFLDTQVGSTTQVVESGTTYSVASGSDAAAGNRYDETVYAIPGSSSCTAVRYFIHYGAIQNYPAGVVTEFNKAALTAEFDAIRRSLVLSK